MSWTKFQLGLLTVTAALKAGDMKKNRILDNYLGLSRKYKIGAFLDIPFIKFCSSLQLSLCGLLGRRLGSDITKDVGLPGVKTKFVYQYHRQPACTCITTERSLVLCYGGA